LSGEVSFRLTANGLSEKIRKIMNEGSSDLFFNNLSKN
jgi:hypothetical protein